MLRKIRIAAAAVFFTMITLLFLDFTGTLHAWFGWMARVQLLPAVLAVNVAVVAALLVLTLLFGRVYCSVICPLGVFQDVASWAGGRRRKNRFTYSRALPWLRYGMLALFVAAMVAHIKPVAELLAPYSAYGRIASNLFAPLYRWGNNLLAHAAERIDSYAFYTVDVWVKSGVTFAVAAATFAVLAVLAWRNGRTYCNTVCPVGTLLGFVSRFAVFKPRIDTSKCNGCGLCARNCKASCIDAKSHEIDYSRCVACMDCIGKCRQHAIAFSRKPAAKPASETSASAAAVAPAKTDRVVAAESSSKAERVVAADRPADPSRRKFLTIAGVLAYTATVKAQEKKVDGGLALIEDKKVPDRAVPITPPGSLAARNLTAHCTGCQLCVAACPNQVLRPSGKLMTLMQPEMSYERGYCRPECTKCSEVCPTGAIRPITVAEKSATQIGHAVWIADNCVVNTDGVDCGNCARHCPTGAIHMVHKDPDNPDSPLIPAVNEERCIGCGACENLCPSRPFSAIYVEGHLRHRTV